MRNEKKILEAEERLNDIVWWNRHSVYKNELKITGDYPPDDIWDKALENAEHIEKEILKEELLLDDFNWGIVNGKLSAIRWVLGSEWDDLGT